MTKPHKHEQNYANLYITFRSNIVLASIDKPDQYRMQMEFWTHQRSREMEVEGCEEKTMKIWSG